MKLTKSSLKELIRQSIYELKEGGKGSGPNKGDRKGMDYKDGKPDNISASDWKKMDADEKEYHTSGQYAKDAERDDTGKDDEPYTDDDENHGGWSEGKISESKTRRFTVKEVQKWMKTLEENRYKKVYNSDCRRVSWMANNMNEDVTNMPISMRKKWTKAQYGRERYLAKEFLKSKMGEQKLRESIRKIVIGLINENNISNINKFWNKDVKLTSPEGKSMKKENAKLIKLLNNELKKLGVQADFKQSLRFTGATTRINGQVTTVRFTGPQGSKIQSGGKTVATLKPNSSIKDIAKQISKLG